ASAFESMLDSDPALYEELAHKTLLHAHIVQSISEDPNMLPNSGQPAVDRRPLFLVLAGVCFMALLAVPILFWSKADAEKNLHIATLFDTQNAQWGGCDQPTREGSLLQPGLLNLTQGLCSIRFHSGVEIQLEAPASLYLKDEMNVQLLAGTAVTSVPPPAIGFTIDTPQGTIIDKGTEFLTSVNPESETTLTAVIDGEVQVLPKQKANSQLKSIFAGEQIVMDASANQTLTPSAWSEFSLLTDDSPPTSDRGDKLVFRTSDEASRDGTAFQLNKNHHYRQDLIMVKHSGKDLYSRIGYLGFDLGQADLSKAVEVELELNAVPSGFGSAALSGDATFTLWGITNDQDDDWGEGLIPWETAPGAIESPSQLSTSRARRLGSFSLQASQSHARVLVSTEALLDYCREDTNQFVSLAISCDSVAKTPAGKVYAFEGALSEGGAEPKLRVRF
ncbi:MAG: FecR family protein, partial [Verrucomicrobiota bacterium]